MADSIEIVKASCHARSSSWPCTSHPLTASLEDRLYKLKATQATPSSLSNNLATVKDLLESFIDLIKLPSYKQALSSKKCGAEEILEGSLRLLDVCSTARDVLLHTKESIQELESSLRRKRGGELALDQEISSYMISRKKVNKMVFKCIRSSNHFEKQSPSRDSNEDRELVDLANMINEVENVTFSVLKSVLLHVSGTKATPKKSSWSLVSKFVQPKRVSSTTQEETEGLRLEKINGALYALTIKKSCKDINIVAVQNVLKQLQASEDAMQKIEEGLEPVFRCLVKTRVSILNVLNH